MQTLVDRGLFEICPGLADEAHWQSWPKRMNILRNEIVGSPLLVQAEDVRTAIRIGKAWGPFELDAATMVLSMSPYDVIASAFIILDELLEVYTDSTDCGFEMVHWRHQVSS
ncbi:hypothetical protein LY76DRAFT_209312 [Colletotrichum caudatum]|nr:hypothetical protein LY76DRAFT_209312 [Colletotrichum caudatum]